MQNYNNSEGLPLTSDDFQECVTKLGLEDTVRLEPKYCSSQEELIEEYRENYSDIDYLERHIRNIKGNYSGPNWYVEYETSHDTFIISDMESIFRYMLNEHFDIKLDEVLEAKKLYKSERVTGPAYGIYDSNFDNGKNELKYVLVNDVNIKKPNLIDIMLRINDTPEYFNYEYEDADSYIREGNVEFIEYRDIGDIYERIEFQRLMFNGRGILMSNFYERRP